VVAAAAYVEVAATPAALAQVAGVALAPVVAAVNVQKS